MSIGNNTEWLIIGLAQDPEDNSQMDPSVLTAADKRGALRFRTEQAALDFFAKADLPDSGGPWVVVRVPG